MGYLYLFRVSDEITELGFGSEEPRVPPEATKGNPRMLFCFTDRPRELFGYARQSLKGWEEKQGSDRYRSSLDHTRLILEAKDKTSFSFYTPLEVCEGARESLVGEVPQVKTVSSSGKTSSESNVLSDIEVAPDAKVAGTEKSLYGDQVRSNSSIEPEKEIGPLAWLDKNAMIAALVVFWVAMYFFDDSGDKNYEMCVEAAYHIAAEYIDTGVSEYEIDRRLKAMISRCAREN